MFPWALKQKAVNISYTTATATELPIPLATEAKKSSIENLGIRIKQAEEAIFNEACKVINEQIEKGSLLAYFDFYSPVYRVDEKLDINSIIAAGSACITRLEDFGYSAKLNGRYMEISWQYPKEITLDEAWTLAERFI